MRPKPTNPAPRRGFTLIEILVSTCILSIIFSAMVSALLLATNTVPAEDDSAIVAARADTALEHMLTDACIARSIVVNSGELSLVVPDQTGDAADDTVVYSLIGSELRRTMNGGAPIVLADDLASALFQISYREEHAARLTITLRSRRGIVIRGGVEIVSRP